MGNPAIFLPVVVLAFWTMTVSILIPLTKARAAAPSPDAGRALRTGEVPPAPPVSVANRNFMNLLEVPVLFYVACLVLYVTGGAAYVTIALAWVYVALRLVHSVIHLTYNRVPHRGAVFGASNVVVVALWVFVAVHVVAVVAIPR